MREPIHIARAEDKTTTQLERISPEFVLRVSGGFGAGASLSIIASQQVKQVCVLELHGGIGFALFVNEQRKGDTRFVAKSSRIAAIPKPNCGQGRSAVSEGLFVRAQLRDVLAAENSAVMTQENYHGRLADPQRTKTEFLTVCVRQGNHGKAIIEGAVHCPHSEWTERCVKPASARIARAWSEGHKQARGKTLSLRLPHAGRHGGSGVRKESQT